MEAQDTFNHPSLLPPPKAVGQIYALFAATVVLMVVIGGPLQFWNVHAGLAVTEFVFILGPALAFVAWKRLPIAEALRLRPVDPSLLLLSMGVGIGGMGLLVGMLELLKPWIGEVPGIQALEPRTVTELLLVLGAGAIGAGVCEETLFRGVILGALVRRGRWWGIIGTAILFGAFHLNPWQFAAGLVMGAVFGYMVESSGSLVPAIVAHTSVNATAFTLSYVFRDRAGDGPGWLPWMLAVAFAASLWQFHRRTRSMSPMPSPLATIPLQVPRNVCWRFALVPLTGLALLITLRAAGVVQAYRMSTNALAPEIARGDVAIVVGTRWLSQEIKPGDHVACRSGGRIMIRRLQKVEGDSLTIWTDDRELPLPRAVLLGKVVRTIRSP